MARIVTSGKSQGAAAHPPDTEQLPDYFAAGATAATKDWSWVDPETDPPSRTAATEWPTGFGRATDVENAPGSAKLIGRGWIGDIQ